MPDAILVLYPPSPFGLSCTLKCEPVPGRVVRILISSPCCTLPCSNKVVCACCLLVCVHVGRLCAFQQKVDSAFSKIRIKQLKHHVNLNPNLTKTLPHLQMASRSGTWASRNRTPAAADAGVQPNGQNPPQEEQEVS